MVLVCTYRNWSRCRVILFPCFFSKKKKLLSQLVVLHTHHIDLGTSWYRLGELVHLDPMLFQCYDTCTSANLASSGTILIVSSYSAGSGIRARTNVVIWVDIYVIMGRYLIYYICVFIEHCALFWLSQLKWLFLDARTKVIICVDIYAIIIWCSLLFVYYWDIYALWFYPCSTFSFFFDYLWNDGNHRKSTSQRGFWLFSFFFLSFFRCN